jgi:hypothetical protein
MSAPEYLSLFSQQGSIAVEVKTQDGKIMPIRKMAIEPDELEKLVSPSTGNIIDEISIDEFLYCILKFEIAPKQKKLTIWVANKV